jgi:hypothetical protein
MRRADAKSIGLMHEQLPWRSIAAGSLVRVASTATDSVYEENGHHRAIADAGLVR